MFRELAAEIIIRTLFPKKTRCLFVDRVKKKKVQISSPVQGCESLPYWSDTGVSRDNLIQNGFAIKQQSFIPNKRLPLPAWGERKKNPFPLVLKLEAGCCIMLGGPGSQVCSSGIRLVFAAAARTSLGGGGGRRGALPNICFVWDHMHAPKKRTAEVAVKPPSLPYNSAMSRGMASLPRISFS